MHPYSNDLQVMATKDIRTDCFDLFFFFIHTSELPLL